MPIETKPAVYTTSDGTEYADAEDAKEHEHAWERVEAWIATLPDESAAVMANGKKRRDTRPAKQRAAMEFLLWEARR